MSGHREEEKEEEEEEEEGEEGEEEEEEEEEEEGEGAAEGCGEGVRVTPQLLVATTGRWALETVLVLVLRDRGIAHLGCLGRCRNLEWLDLSGNRISRLDPLAALRSLAVLNLARNRVSDPAPLAACQNLQVLNLAGNRLRGLRGLRCLRGLRRLESLRLRDPRDRTNNPLCRDNPRYRDALAQMFPGLKAIDGERLDGDASDFYRLCRDLEGSAGDTDGGTGGGTGDGGGDAAGGVGGTGGGGGGTGDAGDGAAARPAAQPWVQGGFWDPPRGSRVAEEAQRQFGEVLSECRDLARRADDAIAQAQRALGNRQDQGSFVF
ncbi:leucine-rich repeat-containing protein 61 [Heliangelus exortis]|uniref:leucine-rich repeat-containing protein 61 n=1 Tax=Heliangelus exortis TaxID=472823 RepID=UPI003A8F3AE9